MKVKAAQLNGINVGTDDWRVDEVTRSGVWLTRNGSRPFFVTATMLRALFQACEELAGKSNETVGG